MTRIAHHLSRCAELAAFCAQNGRIDPQTLDCQVLAQDDHHLLVFVKFEEILLDGTDRIAGRIPHEGNLHLSLDRYGEVVKVELV